MAAADRGVVWKNVDAGALVVAEVLLISGWPKIDFCAEDPAGSPNLVEKEGVGVSPNFFENAGVAVLPKTFGIEGSRFSPKLFVTVKVGASGFSPEPKPPVDCEGAVDALLVSGMKKLWPSSSTSSTWEE